MKFSWARIVVVLLLLLVLPLVAWRMYLAHVISRQLAEIRSAGLPTNGDELNRWYAVVPDNQNAALVLTQAFTLLTTINTSSDRRAEEAWEFKDKFPRRVNQLTDEQVGLINWYLETNMPALTKAHEALNLPLSRYPIDCRRLMATELPHLAHIVNLAYLNQCAAALADLGGQHNEATTQITNMLALGRTLDNEPCLLSQLVRFRIIGMAFKTLERRANSGPFISAEIASLAGTFEQTPATNQVALALIGERALTIPYFTITRTEYETIHPMKKDGDLKMGSVLPFNGPFILKLIGYYDLDYGTYLLGMSKAITLLSNAPPENLRANGYFARVGEESKNRQRALSGVLLSSYAGIARRENEAIAQQRLVLTALAVESFRNETARLPKNLDELTPKYFEEVPEDPFTGWDLEYRRTQTGYVIYSVGPDRTDNGGLEKTDKKQSEDKQSYDITFTVER